MTLSEPTRRSLRIEICRGNECIAIGTGFVVKRGDKAFLITNRHNATGLRPDNREPLSAGARPDNFVISHQKNPADGSLLEWQPCREPLYRGEAPLWIEHPTRGSSVDVIALPLTVLDGVILEEYDLSTDSPISIAPGEVVSIIGFPTGASSVAKVPVWITGFIASESDLDAEDMPTILVDCSAIEGCSGSPAIAMRRGSFTSVDGSVVQVASALKLIGVYSGRSAAAGGMRRVWKIHLVREMLDKP